jgi:hypothetical protein
MTTRFRGIALVLALAVGAPTAAGCGGPYVGKAEKLKRPAKKKRPPEPDAAALPYNEDCKAAFFEDNSKVRRNSGAARGKVGQGDAALGAAESSPDPGVRASSTIEAINSYKKALLDDPFSAEATYKLAALLDVPFSAEATYKLAAAYARVRKKKCAIDLLTRLAQLKKHPDFEAEASRMIQAASQDGSFQGFRKDADGALGI